MNDIKVLHPDKAWEIAEKAYKRIREAGKGGAITIVSSHGRKILQFTMEGVTSYNAHLSELKATQACQIGRSTRFIRDGIADPDHPYSSAILNIPEDQIVPWAGGLPIMDKDFSILGGIGISILKEDEDEEVAIYAVESCGLICAKP